ncbi:MAG: hypothetical protein VB118_05670 [Oscillospiraceae bacterium]|nr:hypothetical protein [Oscillospiraceae bacterium]
MISKLTVGLLALTIAGGLSITSLAAGAGSAAASNNCDSTSICTQSNEKTYVQLTDEQKADIIAKAKERLAQGLADGKITQEQYDKAIAAIDNGKLPFLGKGGFFGIAKSELTDEQKAEMIAKAKERLAQSLADGKITQEQYDKAITAIDNGKLPFLGKGGFFGIAKSELTDEQKADIIAKAKERLAQSLADGKITQEQYDKAIAAIDNGKLPMQNRQNRKTARFGCRRGNSEGTSVTGE